MTRRRHLLASALALASAGASAAFRDPLDRPADPVRNPERRPLLAVATAGQRLVAVGLRGLVIASDDAGATWEQVPLNVGSDLTSLVFTSAARGWACGHDGLILSTEDAGRHWTVRLDGRQMARLLTRHFEQQMAAGQPGADKLLEAIRMNFATGPEQPVLGVWFDDANTGWAVSTFGMILGTQDGGRSWTSWIERVDNPDALHFYAIQGVGRDVYITSERGRVFKLDRIQQRFVALSTGYEGGLFGLLGCNGALLAYGLQGNALRSRDGGSSWQHVNTGIKAGLNGGVLLPDGRMALVSQDGRLLMTSDQGSNFKVTRVPQPGLLTSVTVIDRQLVVSGFNGIQRMAL